MLRLRALQSVPLAIGYWTGIAGRQLRGSECPRILTFHGTAARHAGELERQLRYLRRQFRVVSLHALVEALAAGGRGLGGQVALTFDDGLRSNVLVAYPILQKLRIPATFFVCPELIDRNAWLWNTEARQRLLSLARGELAELADEFGTASDVEDIVQWMKTLALAPRRRAEARVREASGRFKVSGSMREECDLAGWDELRRLDPGLVTIGSHTLTHSILPNSSNEELEAEVAGSRYAAESRLQRSVELFSYPNGDQDERVRNCARSHYRAAVTTEESWVRRDCDLHLLPRVGAPRGAMRLCWNMHLPAYLPCGC